MVIAERIRFRYSEIIVVAVLWLLLGVGGIVLSKYCDSLLGIFICVGIIAIGEILLLIDGIRMKKHNNLPAEVIVYKDDVFELTDEYGYTTVFEKEDVVNMDYKIKVTHVITPYFIGKTEWNYGRLRIWLRNPDNDDLCTVFTLKNIAEPDRVVDKINFIIKGILK